MILHLNNKFQQFIIPLESSFSVDEAMEPYYGHHSLKQFIRGKPIRYVFKIWCLCTSKGYLVKFEPYTGTGNKEEGKTLGTCITEKLV